jgi:hypothetical protein
MDNDPFSDPFSDAPQGRRGQLFRGLKDHVSPQHLDHLRTFTDTAMQGAKDIGGDIFDTAVDFAANNPDKMERIGEQVGQMAGASMVSPMVGGRAGKTAGKKLGGFLSKKAQQKQGNNPAQSSEPSFDPNDPFS